MLCITSVGFSKPREEPRDTEKKRTSSQILKPAEAKQSLPMAENMDVEVASSVAVLESKEENEFIIEEKLDTEDASLLTSEIKNISKMNKNKDEKLAVEAARSDTEEASLQPSEGEIISNNSEELHAKQDVCTVHVQELAPEIEHDALIAHELTPENNRNASINKNDYELPQVGSTTEEEFFMADEFSPQEKLKPEDTNKEEEEEFFMADEFSPQEKLKPEDTYKEKEEENNEEDTKEDEQGTPTNTIRILGITASLVFGLYLLFAVVIGCKN
ncbi:conserved oligomeric Golgi complex subunit 8-like [Xenopus laevis]|uniref:Conserved oligomeric Golgi complex subunit 8-like n=1 Tax=Xenopus laevis TaxID=8355 RepID=A0A8J1KV77_XENLA|nr:conserved oligomeric Golgi complex subunit 8-like [Xenopus laevis]